jgi:hypothetical protein
MSLIICLWTGAFSEPEPDSLLSMMALSSDVMVSVHKPAHAPATAVRQVKPLLTPVEALSALESAVAASFVLDVDALSADTDIASAEKHSDLSACIDDLSQAIAGFVAHGSVGARLPRSAVVLGKAQSQLRALRKQAMARVALAELHAGALRNTGLQTAANRQIPDSYQCRHETI